MCIIYPRHCIYMGLFTAANYLVYTMYYGILVKYMRDFF